MAFGGDLIGRSVLELATDNRKLDKGIGQANKSRKGLEKNFSATAGAIRSAFGSLGLALAIRKVVDYSDSWLAVTNQLKIVTGSARELETVQRRLFDIAQRTRSPIEGTVQLYSRLSLAAEELGADQSALMKFTEGVGQALAITNTSAQEAKGSLLQLSQALGSGVVRAEEFTSVLEGTPRIARAVATGIGLNVAQLRSMVAEGKITSKEFFQAFMSQLPTLREEFGQTRSSIGQAFTGMGNSITRFVGELDTVTGGSSLVAAGIRKISEEIDKLTAAVNKSEIDKLNDQLLSLAATAASRSRFGGNTAGIELEIKAIERQIEALRKKEAASLSAGNNAKSDNDKESSAREKVLAAMNRQLGQQLVLESLSGSVKEAQAARFKAEEVLREKNIDLKGEEAQATLRLIFTQQKELSERQEAASKIKAALEKQKAEIKSFAKATASSMGSVTSQFAQGAISAEQFVHRAIQAIAQLIIQIGILKAVGGGVGGSFLSSFAGGFGGGFAEGTPVGQPLRPGKAYAVGERGPELFLPNRSGAIIPNDAMPGGDTILNQNFYASGMDFSSEKAARRFFQAGAAQMRSGAAELLAFGRALADQNTLNPGRAYG